MLYKTRVSILLGAVTALFLLAQSASALSLPGFPVHAPTIKPVKMVQLCERTMQVAGITIKVPRICKDTPPPPPAVPQLTLTATPTTITAGGSATLAWDSTDATTCTASNGWSGEKSLDGSEVVSPTETKTYTLTCVNGENSVVKSVTVTVNPAPPAPGTLRVIKVVTNDNTGTKTASDFSFQVDGGVAVVFEADGQNDMSVAPGTYSVTEVAVDGYSIGYDNCTSVSVTSGDVTTCTITNNDIAPAPTTGTLVVDKVTQPGGDTTEFAITVTGSGAITGGGAGVVTDAANKSYEVAPGTYSVAETAVEGWQVVSNTCVDIVVALGETETCVITNAKLPKLTVTKVVVNDDLGEKVVADFALFVNATPVTSGVQITATVGTHTVSETPDSGYTGVISGDCAADGSITLIAGDVKSCTITNNDTVPVPPVGALLITEVVYDLGVGQGAEPGNEWVELYNGTNSDINLSGYVIRDATGSDTLPDVVLPAGKFAFISGSSTTAGLWNVPVDTVVIVLANSTIGGGLANGGDMVALENASFVQLDAVSWGSNTTAFSPSVATVADGHSIARSSKTTDTNTATDWVDLETPTPGL